MSLIKLDETSEFIIFFLKMNFNTKITYNEEFFWLKSIKIKIILRMSLIKLDETFEFTVCFFKMNLIQK